MARAEFEPGTESSFALSRHEDADVAGEPTSRESRQADVDTVRPLSQDQTYQRALSRAADVLFDDNPRIERGLD